MRETTRDKLFWIDWLILHLCQLLLCFWCYCLVIKTLFLRCLIGSSIRISFFCFYISFHSHIIWLFKYSLRFLNNPYYWHMSYFNIGLYDFTETHSDLSYLFDIWLLQIVLNLIFFQINHLERVKWIIIDLFLAIKFASFRVIVIYSYCGWNCFGFAVFIDIIFFFLGWITHILFLFLIGCISQVW